MEYKNQTENRAFQEMLLAAVKRLQNRSGEEIAAKSGAVFHSSRNVLEVLSFYETIEIQLPEFRINSNLVPRINPSFRLPKVMSFCEPSVPSAISRFMKPPKFLHKH